MIKSIKMAKNSKLNFLTKIFILCGLWVFMLNPGELQATHIVGGNLTYKHVSGDTYQVKLVLRRDCLLGSPEAEFDNPASISIFTAGGSLAIWLSNNGQIKIPFTASDTLNQFIRSDCGFEGTQVCVHETTYLGNVILPARTGGYILAYQRCCRNASLNNILDPLETGSTYWVAINDKSLALKNSSPTFNQWPDVYICANKPLVFDHKATDPEGDSLVYKLCTPSLGATRINPKPQPAGFPPYVNILFAPPYNLEDMMGGTPLKIDSKTGQITANPNLVGQFLIGICVEEYRNGQLLSTIRRDFQYNVRVCSQPPLAQFTTSETNCDGLKVEFYNNSLSSSAYQWDFNYPSTDPIFKSTAPNPVFTFPASGIYNVRLRATRGSDGCFDTIVQKVAVFENKILPDFNYALSGCNESNDSLEITLSDLSSFEEPGYTLNDWKWNVTQNGQTKSYSGKNPKIDLSNSGNIDVSLEVFATNGCRSVFTRQIAISELIPKLDFGYELLGCPSEGLATIRLTNLSEALNPFATLDSTKWLIGTQSFTGNQADLNLPQDTKQFSVTLQNTFRDKCKTNLTKSFDLSALVPAAAYGYTPVSCPDEDNVKISLFFVDSLSNGIGTSAFNWSAGTITGQNQYSGQNIEVVIPKDSLMTFQLAATFANGCIDKIGDSFLPGPFASVTFLSDTLIICEGDEQTLIINGNPDWQYTWSPTSGLDLSVPSNPKIITDTNQTYMVTVSDGLCSVTGGVVVIALKGGIILDIEADTISCDGSVTLNASGGLGQGTYTWATNPEFTQIAGVGQSIQTSFEGNAAIYYVKFVGEACSTEPAIIRVENQKPSIDDASPYKFCPLDTSKVLTINLIDNHINTYVWDSDVHIVAGANTASPLIGIGSAETQSFALYYTVTNQFGCSVRDTIQVNLAQNPVADFNFNLTSCGKYEVCFNTAGNYEGFIKWDFGDPATTGDVSLINTPCYTYGGGGVYEVTLVNLVNTCPFYDVKKQIIVNPQIALNQLEDQLICKGDSIKFLATANLQDVNYQWLDMNGNILSGNNRYETFLQNDASFIVKGSDIYGCTDSDTVSVKVFKFVYSVDMKDSLCVNEPTQIQLLINPDSDYQFSWSPAECIISGANTSKPVILPVSGKTLSVVLKHISSSCVDSVSIAPKVTQPFIFDVDVPEVFCLDQPTPLLLNIVNPALYDFLWTPSECVVSGANTKDPQIKVSIDKTLNVKVTNKSSGCVQDLDVDVKAGEEIDLVVDAQPDFTIFEGESLDIFIKDAMEGEVYSWSTGDKGDTITVRPVITTNYTVTVTDVNGCMASDEVTVTVRNAQCDETDVYIPNAFTPNNDGTNDVFRVRSNFIDELELIIYNRWGQEVYKSNDLNVGWDGTFNGKELGPDAYAYYVRVKCVNSETYTKKGNVNLLR